MYNSHFETVSLSYLASATYLLLNSAQVRGYGVTLCKKKEPDLFQKSIGCGKRTNTVKSWTLMLVTYQKIQFFFKGQIDIKIPPHKQSEMAKSLLLNTMF